MIQTILMSQFPLPYSHIGSWTTLYRNYLESGHHQIDTIICEKPARYFEGVEYVLVTDSPAKRFGRKISGNTHAHFVAALKKALVPGMRYIIQIVDNFGLAKAVQYFLQESGHAKTCYVQYFYHGFSPFGKSSFFEKVNEVVLLTHLSYRVFLQMEAMPTAFSVQHNGVDPNKFFPITAAEKALRKKDFGFENKTIFVWCSQDRPKKGLRLILDVWRRIAAVHPDAVLLIIGCPPREPQPGVHYVGRISNDQIPQYYQMSDVFLMPTLCLEGFGMVLIEALHCGCYCMASALGGVPEVLQFGQLGKLIQNPHFIADWVAAIEEYLSDSPATINFPKDLYTARNWNQAMNVRIEQAKINMGNG